MSLKGETHMNEYLAIIQDIAQHNKYTKWYVAIIKNAKPMDGYQERHHILPKCFNMGGEVDEDNIVMLTAREHYICHLLMTRMFTNKRKRYQMILAFVRMSNTTRLDKNRQYSANSILYAHAKQQMSLQMKVDNPNSNGVHSKRAWQQSSDKRRIAQSRLIAELNRRLKTKPKETRMHVCTHCGKDVITEEFIHHPVKQAYYCGAVCRNRHSAAKRTRPRQSSANSLEPRRAWNKGIPNPKSAENGRKGASKQSQTVTGRKRKYLSDGSWCWEYPKAD